MDNQSRYIWQQPDWPCWRHDLPALFPLLIEVSQAQGRLLGRLQDLGEAQRAEASLGVLTEDVLKTSEIEGESLDVRSVRSSLARRLGVDVGGVAPVDRHVEGVVEMVLDATTNCHAQLTAERLFGWHAALFPTGYSGMVRIGVGQWRTDARGPMQVVSGPMHRPRVHFQAPPAATLPEQMAAFLAWANTSGLGVTADVPVNGARADALLKAGLAHLWFVTLHPFEDGNGRIARAIALRWQHGTFLQLVGADRARAQGVLRHPGADAEGQHGCDGLAVLVSGHVGTDAGQCACNAGCGADEGTLLAALGQYPDESAADQAAEPASGRLRRQAHQQPLGQHGQVLAGYGAA